MLAPNLGNDRMETRILFNGQEYAGPEAMPPDVRRAYERALAAFADADRNGIPDILERGALGNVVVIRQSSITVNGKDLTSVGEMPAPVRQLYEQAMAQLNAGGGTVTGSLEVSTSGSRASERARSDGRVPTFTARGTLRLTQETVLRVLLVVAAVAILVFGVIVVLRN